MTTVFMRPKIRTILVSSKVSGKEAESLGMEYAPTVQEGLKVLERSYPNAKVAIFPSGGLIVPITAWDR
jgi:hypothetical protein